MKKSIILCCILCMVVLTGAGCKSKKIQPLLVEKQYVDDYLSDNYIKPLDIHQDDYSAAILYTKDNEYCIEYLRMNDSEESLGLYGSYSFQIDQADNVILKFFTTDSDSYGILVFNDADLLENAKYADIKINGENIISNYEVINKEQIIKLDTSDITQSPEAVLYDKDRNEIDYIG